MLPTALLANLLFTAPQSSPTKSILQQSYHCQNTAHIRRDKSPHTFHFLSTSLAESERSEPNSLNSQINRFYKFRTAVYNARCIERILLLSDLHCDYAANRNWLENMCTNDYSQTMILVGGDVSHDLEILSWTFRTLKRTFREVAFVPGNHDLWLDKQRKHRAIATKLDSADERPILSGVGDGCNNSLEKLEKIFQLCKDEDVCIGPVKVENEQSALWIVPLLSWYHSSFDTEPPIECWGGIPSATKVVTDYRRAVWPEPLSPLDDSVAQFLDDLNDVILDWNGVDQDRQNGKSTSILTFSHFLPRIELLPEKRYLSLPSLPTCVGSTFLEARLRKVQTQCSNQHVNLNHLHAFGHSHLSWDQNIEGVRYVHVPLAYPREWEQRRRSLEIGTMQGDLKSPVCIWEKQPHSPAHVAGSNNGFPKEWLGGWWSKYYDIMPRQPHRNKELSPWAARRFRKLPGGSIENFDHVKVELEHKLQHPSYWKAGSGSCYTRSRKSS